MLLGKIYRFFDEIKHLLGARAALRKFLSPTWREKLAKRSDMAHFSGELPIPIFITV